MCAQTPETPKPVPIKEEPHHRLVLENDYVRVFRFSLPGHEATLLHAHELPYVAVALGPADYINAVPGKPEAHVVLTDGQVGYSRGGFAHIVRTDAGGSFNNFTIELQHPQGEPRNLCQKVTDGPVADCPTSKADAAAGNPSVKTLDQAVEKKPLFETGEIVVTSFSIALKEDYSESGAQPARLLAVEQDSELKVDVPGERSKSLHGGEVLWLEAGKEWRIATPGDHKVTRFLLITFKDGDNTKKP
ncbi:MAG: hypothetical protein WBL63_05155 [Candidatus Acidiferrum sp.]